MSDIRPSSDQVNTGNPGMPRVSLGLPVYNGEAFVAEAIRSILDQDFDDFELIITDNASSDRTEEICRQFAARDRRIRYVRNDRNLGAGGNFNRAFELGSGEFFKWCAHDDFINPGFLRAGVVALAAAPDAVVAYGELEYVDSTGAIIPRGTDNAPDVSVFGKTFPDMGEMTPGQRYRIVVAAGGCDNAMFGLMRRSALARTSLHRKYYMSDRALLVELAVLGTFVETPGMILYNRDHPDRSTKLADKLARTKWTNPEIRNNRCLEHLSLLSHQFEIAWRARRSASLASTLPYLTFWSLHPFRVSCYALEIIGFMSPGLRRNIGVVIRKLARPLSRRSGDRLAKSCK